MTFKPSDYRASYRKTVVVALAISILSIVLAALAFASLRHGAGTLATAGILFVLVMLAFAAAGYASVVALGGSIALRRDAQEERGMPYFSNQPREWQPGWGLGALLAGARTLWCQVLASRSGLALHAGDWVLVKEFDEIAATLDENGTLNGLPFMAEMVGWCGSTARVERRVDKLHDWIGGTGLRRVHSTVQLRGIRCDGSFHGGCQANCHIRWNEAWLRRTAPPKRHELAGLGSSNSLARPIATEANAGRMVCQATQLTAGTKPLSRGLYGRYVRDLVDGNVRPRAFLSGLSLAAFNGVQHWRGGVEFPFYDPPAVRSTPDVSLSLRPGEFVRVRSKREIEATLNAASRNRGLRFDPDMLRYCGGVFRVRDRVERTIAEASGVLRQLTRASITLEGVTATGEYREFNPENEWIFWREIWLERAQPPATEP